MKLATVTLLAALATASAHAQVPHIVGTWTLDRGRTVYPGPLPEIDIRQYRMSEDGWLVGPLDPANPQTFMLVYTRQEPDQAAPR